MSNDTPKPLVPSQRLASIDAYRGLVMLLMMAEVLHLAKVKNVFPESKFWSFLALHQSHVEWAGCTLHDLIQPSFSFLVGVALPFSLASRSSQGQPKWMLILHAAWRAFVLCALGIWLRSIGRGQTNFTFEDTLTQIGLGYFPLFLLAYAQPRWHWVTATLLLVGYWCLFAFYPLPAADFYSLEKVNVPPDWPQHYSLETFNAHWNKNSNPAWAFDTWFLNLFPREKPFLFNGGGYATLSFLPTLATMILGLIAGGWIHRAQTAPGDASTLTPWRAIGYLLLAVVGCFALALVVDYCGLCPIVKRIWTPSWTLFSGGWCFLFLAAFYGALDVGKLPYVAFPLQVIGANSIAAYMLDHLIKDFTAKSLKTHLGERFFQFAGYQYEPILLGAAILLIEWLILFWMYRRKLFLKV